MHAPAAAEPHGVGVVPQQSFLALVEVQRHSHARGVEREDRALDRLPRDVASDRSPLGVVLLDAFGHGGGALHTDLGCHLDVLAAPEQRDLAGEAVVELTGACHERSAQDPPGQRGTDVDESNGEQTGNGHVFSKSGSARNAQTNWGAAWPGAPVEDMSES